MPSANDRIREVSTNIVERFDDKDATLARLALVGSSPQYLRAFAKAATNRLHTLTQDEQRALEEVRAMSLTDSAGGYLVPFQLDPTVIITANGSRNDIRRIAAAWPGIYLLQKAYKFWSLLHYILAQNLKDAHTADPNGPALLVPPIQSWNLEAVLLATKLRERRAHLVFEP